MKNAHIVAIVLSSCLLLPTGIGAPAFGAPEQSTLAEAAEAARKGRAAEGESEARTYSNKDLTTESGGGEGRPGAPAESERGESLDVPPAPPAGTTAPSELARYTVPYRAFEGTARRVIVTVRFNGSVTAPIALDTGAPGTIIFPELADRLGLFDANRRGVFVSVGGIGGSVPALRTIIDTVEVGGARQEFALVTIVPPISSSFEGLLGLDFLAMYSVRIDPQAEDVVLEELPTDSSWHGGRNEGWWRASFAELNSTRQQWAEYRDQLASRRNEIGQQRELLAFADSQLREADNLLSRLSRRARQFAVPMHWRFGGSR